MQRMMARIIIAFQPRSIFESGISGRIVRDHSENGVAGVESRCQFQRRPSSSYSRPARLRRCILWTEQAFPYARIVSVAFWLGVRGKGPAAGMMDGNSVREESQLAAHSFYKQ